MKKIKTELRTGYDGKKTRLKRGDILRLEDGAKLTVLRKKDGYLHFLNYGEKNDFHFLAEPFNDSNHFYALCLAIAATNGFSIEMPEEMPDNKFAWKLI